MRPYFEKMKEFGQELKPGQIKSTEANVGKLQEVEALVEEAVAKVKNAGLPAEKINARGQLTVWQRLDYLVDEGTWSPLHILYNPTNNVEGTNNVIDAGSERILTGQLTAGSPSHCTGVSGRFDLTSTWSATNR